MSSAADDRRSAMLDLPLIGIAGSHDLLRQAVRRQQHANPHPGRNRLQRVSDQRSPSSRRTPAPADSSTAPGSAPSSPERFAARSHSATESPSSWSNIADKAAATGFRRDPRRRPHAPPRSRKRQPIAHGDETAVIGAKGGFQGLRLRLRILQQRRSAADLAIDLRARSAPVAGQSVSPGSSATAAAAR